MTEYNMKHLSKDELIEIYIAKERQSEELRKKLEQELEEERKEIFRHSISGSLRQAFEKILTVIFHVQKKADSSLRKGKWKPDGEWTQEMNMTPSSGETSGIVPVVPDALFEEAVNEMFASEQASAAPLSQTPETQVHPARKARKKQSGSSHNPHSEWRTSARKRKRAAPDTPEQKKTSGQTKKADRPGGTIGQPSSPASPQENHPFAANDKAMEKETQTMAAPDQKQQEPTLENTAATSDAQTDGKAAVPDAVHELEMQPADPAAETKPVASNVESRQQTVTQTPAASAQEAVFTDVSIVSNASETANAAKLDIPAEEKEESDPQPVMRRSIKNADQNREASLKKIQTVELDPVESGVPHVSQPVSASQEELFTDEPEDDISQDLSSLMFQTAGQENKQESAGWMNPHARRAHSHPAQNSPERNAFFAQSDFAAESSSDHSAYSPAAPRPDEAPEIIDAADDVFRQYLAVDEDAKEGETRFDQMLMENGFDQVMHDLRTPSNEQAQQAQSENQLPEITDCSVFEDKASAAANEKDLLEQGKLSHNFIPGANKPDEEKHQPQSLPKQSGESEPVQAKAVEKQTPAVPGKVNSVDTEDSMDKETAGKALETFVVSEEEPFIADKFKASTSSFQPGSQSLAHDESLKDLWSREEFEKMVNLITGQEEEKEAKPKESQANWPQMTALNSSKISSASSASSVDAAPTPSASHLKQLTGAFMKELLTSDESSLQWVQNELDKLLLSVGLEPSDQSAVSPASSADDETNETAEDLEEKSASKKKNGRKKKAKNKKDKDKADKKRKEDKKKKKAGKSEKKHKDRQSEKDKLRKERLENHPLKKDKKKEDEKKQKEKEKLKEKKAKKKLEKAKLDEKKRKKLRKKKRKEEESRREEKLSQMKSKAKKRKDQAAGKKEGKTKKDSADRESKKHRGK